MDASGKVVHKFSLENCFANIKIPKTILMPIGAKIICAEMQSGSPHLWAIADPNAETEAREFVIFGTGFELQAGGEPLEHVGTVFVQGFVWHIFEVM